MADPQYGPGTFGCHEALDRTSFLAELVSDLGDHPAIMLKPEWRKLAIDASNKLFDLYQAIGSVHLNTEPCIQATVRSDEPRCDHHTKE